LLSTADVTAAAEAIAQRWHAAREQYREQLQTREGEANFAGWRNTRWQACHNACLS